MTAAAAFKAKVEELIGEAEKAGDLAAAKAIHHLGEAREKVAAAVASTDWQLYHLPQLKAATERAMSEFGSRFGVMLNEEQSAFWQRGADLVDKPLRTVGIVAVIPEIDSNALTALQAFGLDKVKGLTADAVDKINTELSLGIMGGKQPFEVMKAVGRNLDEPSIFKTLANRAYVITHQECGKALEAAGQQRKEKAAEVVPGLQKQWYYGHSPKMPRPEHVAANGQIRDVSEPFEVGGEKLMYPKDPGGSPQNTIKCG